MNKAAGALCLGAMIWSLGAVGDRIHWTKMSEKGRGAISSNYLQNQLGLDLSEQCKFGGQQMVEFKWRKDDAVTLRCSTLGESTITAWPFFAEIDVESAVHVSQLQLLLRNLDPDLREQLSEQLPERVINRSLSSWESL